MVKVATRGRIYREITRDELDTVFSEHMEWLLTEGLQGQRAWLANAYLEEIDLDGEYLKKADMRGALLKRAQLGGANLEGANFENSNLTEATLEGAPLTLAVFQGADLRDANLKEANLKAADFSGAGLFGASLEGADLTDTAFYDCDLTEADLSGSVGLTGVKLSGAIINRARIPAIEKIVKIQDAEISKNARNIFIIMFLSCIYCWITIASTEDVALITGLTINPLPIFQTNSSITVFFILAPLILLCLYFYFHFYLGRLWEYVSELPAIQWDGKRLDQKLYPWLLNGLVRTYFPHLKDNRHFTSYIQNVISRILGWWFVPITFLLFWFHYLPKKDWIGTTLHIALVFISVTAALHFNCNMDKKLRRKPEKPFYWNKLLKMRPGRIEWITLFFSCILVVITYIGNIPFDQNDNSFLEFIKNETRADLYNAQLKTCNLEGANLLNADLREAILTNALLTCVSMQGCDLRGAELQGAALIGINLQGADLRNADLQEIDLILANIQRADLREANLKGAILYSASLRGTNLASANLRETYLHEADFQEANLQEAKFHKSDLSYADLRGTNLRNANLREANLHGAYLQLAELHFANLEEANLEFANLTEADLRGVDLCGANLRKAVFQRTILLESEVEVPQLCSAKTIFSARLDHETWRLIKKCCPEKLKKTKE